MKKSTGVVILGALVLAYPASAWVVGRQVQSINDRQYAQFEPNPYVKVVQRSYQRGVFAADEVVTIEFSPHALARGTKSEPAEEQPESFKVEFHTHYTHGPFPGFSRVAAAVADTEVVLPGDAGKALADAFGGKPPLSAHTVLAFDGSGKATLAVPAAQFAPPAGTRASDRLTWDAFKATMGFGPEMRNYTVHGTLPKLELDSTESGRLVLTGLSLDAKQQRVFDDNPKLMSGTQGFAAEQIELTPVDPARPALFASGLSYTVDVPTSGDFLDVNARVGAQELKVGKDSFASNHFDLSLKHLHARTLASVLEKLATVYADPAFAAAAEPGDMQRLFAPVQAEAKRLLAHNPELHLDQISFSTPEGETRLSAQLALPGATPADLGTPFILIAKLQASGTLSIPEAVLQRASGTSGAKGDSANPAEAAGQDKAAQLEARLALLANSGYITRNKGIVATQVEFRQGQFTVNGRPFDPSLLAAPTAP